MGAVVIPSVSAEYVKVPIQAPSNPTALPILFAFKTGSTEPETGDWASGAWTGDTVTDGTRTSWVARRLVGAGGTVLAEGVWTVWVKVDGVVEKPARPIGTLVVS